MNCRYPFSVLAVILSGLFAILCSTGLSTAHADFQKTKIAVLDFHVSGDTIQPPGMGAILAEWFIASIVKSGRFDVVDPAILKKKLAGQDLSSTGDSDQQIGKTVGKILGVDIVIVGSATKNGAFMNIHSQAIHGADGSIFAAYNVSGGADSDIHVLADELIAKVILDLPLTGYVVKRTADTVVIDLGLESGLAPGTLFAAYREGRIIKHPKTAEVLDIEQIITGILRITKVSKNVAEGEIQSEEAGGIERGHLVKSIGRENTDTGSGQANKKNGATGRINK